VTSKTNAWENATSQLVVPASAVFAGTSSFVAVYNPPSTGIQIPQGNGGAVSNFIPQGSGGAISGVIPQGSGGAMFGTIPQGNGGATTGTIPQGAGGAVNYQIEKLTQAMLDDALILGEMDA
jgi:hypothetical protein